MRKPKGYSDNYASRDMPEDRYRDWSDDYDALPPSSKAPIGYVSWGLTALIILGSVALFAAIVAWADSLPDLPDSEMRTQAEQPTAP